MRASDTNPRKKRDNVSRAALQPLLGAAGGGDVSRQEPISARKRDQQKGRRAVFPIRRSKGWILSLVRCVRLPNPFGSGGSSLATSPEPCNGRQVREHACPGRILDSDLPVRIVRSERDPSPGSRSTPPPTCPILDRPSFRTARRRYAAWSQNGDNLPDRSKLQAQSSMRPSRSRRPHSAPQAVARCAH
jgi:hypothetical protein